ncbi:MAG: periplasmic heavy metal sensor [Deltaproteobacteria bacterium]|nr:periplasmic heavy metal sensor [Deltaproteobacteria bacterium]
MGGIIIGTLCLLGFVKVWRRARCRAHGGGGGGWMARRVGQRLGATPDQEKVLRESVEAVQRAGWKARAEWPAIRAEAARALRAEAFDEAAWTSALERARAAVTALEATTGESLRALHAALQPTQRQQLADLVEFGPRALR